MEYPHMVVLVQWGDCPCAIPLNHKRLPESSIADWVEHNGFKSEHGNGANFGFVDGSVRFLSEEVDMSDTGHLQQFKVKKSPEIFEFTH